MRHEVFTQKLRDDMARVDLPPELAARLMSAAQGKENRIMKRRITTTLVFAIVLMALTTAAIAATTGGLLDFLSQTRAALPDNAADYIDATPVAAESAGYRAAVLEHYYDGRDLTLLVEVRGPEGTMLLPDDETFAYPYEPELLEEGAPYITNLEHYQQGGFTRACQASTRMTNATSGMSSMARMQDDGSYVTMLQARFDAEQPERELVLQVVLNEYETPEKLSGRYMTIDVPLKVSSSADAVPANSVLVNAETHDFPQAGVRVLQVRMERKPLCILVDIDFEITDEAVYAATENGVWFELVDPSAAGEPYDQRLKYANMNAYSVRAIGADGQHIQNDGGSKAGDRFRQSCDLAVSEWRDTYCLRAYNVWEKTRYETQEIVMQPEKD